MWVRGVDNMITEYVPLVKCEKKNGIVKSLKTVYTTN